MTAPTVAARTSTAEGSGSTSHSISLGTPSAGDLLVVVACTNVTAGVPGVDLGASGTKWWNGGGGASGANRLSVFAKVAEGSDVLTLNTDVSGRITALAYRITGHGSTVAVAAISSGNSTNGDPPNVAQSGSAQDTLFLAAMLTASSVASVAPTGYGTLTTASAACFLSMAEKTANATSDNPGTFTNTSQAWVATTIAVGSAAITTNARETQETIEATSIVDPNMTVTQTANEVVSQNSLNLVMTQEAAEVVSPQGQNLYMTQEAAEVLSGDPWPTSNTGAFFLLF